MCPADQALPEAPSEGTHIEVEVDADDELLDVAAPEDDPLANFAVNAARQQATERGEDENDVDMGFITRALAESRRMRSEASISHKKRADLAASIAARHGEHSLQYMADARAEHAAEVLTAQQGLATASLEVQSAAELE